MLRPSLIFVSALVLAGCPEEDTNPAPVGGLDGTGTVISAGPGGDGSGTPTTGADGDTNGTSGGSGGSGATSGSSSGADSSGTAGSGGPIPDD
jgi:hypothetical protein